MKKEQIKAVLDRVLTWPPERQEQAIRLLSEMEQQDSGSLTLTDEQTAEVRGRLADPDPKFLTLLEVRERFAPAGMNVIIREAECGVTRI